MTNYKKIIFTIWLAIFALSGVVTPRPANAFSDFIGGPTSIIKFVWEKVEYVYDKVQSIVGAELSNRAVSQFLDTMAYDVATQLAEGGPGGKPQFRTISIKKSIQNAGNQALGEFLGELTEKGFDELGIDLCDPSLELKLTLTLGLIDTQKPPKPSCNWRRLQNNWSKFGDRVQADIIKFQLDPKRSGTTSTVDFFRNIASPESTDLGVAYELSAEFNRRKLEAAKALELSVEECRGYIDDKTPITDEVITHCSVNESMSKDLFVSATKIEADKQLAKKQAADNKKLSDILKDAGNRFLDTFTSKLMKNWIKKGMWSLFGDNDNDVYQDYRKTLIDRLRGGSDIRQPRGVDIFKELRTVNTETIESFDYLNTYTICPDQFKQPDNCVMSPAFLQAINNKLTIKQAIKQGVISGDTPFIHSNDAINHTIDKCYRDNLCYTNLVKLRKANIIPVGWELAALRAPVSLQQAIDCFEEGEDCSFGIDDTPGNPYMVDGNFHNPFYHLVDPDWVMKAPNMRCEAFAFSPILESPDSSNRQQYCADPKVCLREDSDGNCLDDQFNYCTRSENIWDFEGKTCESGEIYSGCLTFDNEDFGVNSYIEDSLEYCTADQAGCRRHAQDVDSFGNWVLEDIAVDTNDLFLNRQAKECNDHNAGCSEYIALAPDTGANMIPNSDFEIDLDDNDVADGYAGAANLVDGEGTRDSRAVLAAFRSAGGHIITGLGPINVIPNTNYTVSVDVKLHQTAPGSGAARIAVNTCRDINGDPGGIFPVLNMSTTNDANFVAPIPDPLLPDDEGNLFADVSGLSDSTYTRIQGTFNSGNSVVCGSVYVGANYGNDLPHYFDNLKVEAVSEPLITTDYTPYGEGGKIYMNDNTVMCTADEVGCQGYIPLNGDPMIPAVIVQDDLCPSQCVGYDTFTEQINIFDIIENDLLVEYYNFIPTTAQECPAQEIGCEEFTNLDVVAEGGEGREYFTYLRQCVEEGEGTVFYTWEGTDVAGYQIKTWYSLESNLNSAPCTNMVPEGGVCQDVAFTDNSTPELNEVAACGTDTADTSDDPNNNPNCRAFFDELGDVHYRFQDRVIFATDNCHDYRRSLTSQVYQAVPDESIHCSANNNGCRSYYGNNANNIREVISDNFEHGTYEPWSARDGGPLDLSNVALQNNGHSLVELSGTPAVARSFMRDMLNNPLKVGKTYKISWWMMNTVMLNWVGMDMFLSDGVAPDEAPSILNPSDDSNFQNIEPNRWHQYSTTVTIRPFTDTDEDNITVMDLRLNIENTDGLEQPVYIDNFTIKEIENNFSVVRNSWDTPVICNQPYDGYHLGCQQYVDLNGQEFNLKSFNHLCREDTIGCMPVIDTHNSTNPFQEIFNGGDLSEIIVPVDNLTYLVPNPDNYCSQAAKGCTALGIPDRLDETKFDTVYKLNDPDKYPSIMCDSNGLNCAEYNTAKGVFYLKDPGTDTCTYQQNVLIEDSLLSGWFKTATLGDEPPLGCADIDDNHDTDGDGVYDIRELILPIDYCSVSNTDARQFDVAGNSFFYFTRDDCEDAGGYWNNFLLAGQCPKNENLCTAFKDPADPVACDPKARNLGFEGLCTDSDYSNQTDCETAGELWSWASNDGYCHIEPQYNNRSDCNRNGGEWIYQCRSYYYYDDRNIDEAGCNGLVDRQEGCVLFYDANSWNGEHSQAITIYDSQETYEDIEASNISVSPVACDPGFDPTCNLDSNKLIKVRKDRQCAEWLACKSSTASLDKNTDTYKIICDDLDACVEFQYDPDSNTTKCKKWGSYDEDIEALTVQKYQSRNTGLRNHMSWSDKEYIGYSIPNMLPVNELLVYDFGDEDSPMSRLAYDVTDSVDAGGAYYADCVDVSGDDLNGQACNAEINTDGNYTFRGECQSGLCLINPRVNETGTSTYAIESRAYAIADAPFPAAININLERMSKYKGANICSDNPDETPAPPNSCEISFKRVAYGSGQKNMYYPAEESLNFTIPFGICTAGDILDADDDVITCYENWECDSVVDRHDGICSIKSEEITFRSWPGICLEYDYDTPIPQDEKKSYYCNQWYPAQKIKGTASLYDNYRAAGYFNVNNEDALFCTVAEPYITTEDRFYCGYFNSHGQCNVFLKIPAGSKVNLEEASKTDPSGDPYIALLDEGSWLEADELGLQSPNTTINKDIIVSMPTPGDKYNRLLHFNNIMPNTLSFMNILNNLFDVTEIFWDHDGNVATPEVLQGIHRFYWDDGVRANGTESATAYVSIPNTPVGTWRDHASQCEDCPGIPSCGSTRHRVYERCWKTIHCGWHLWRQREVFCNPLTYNYYIDLNSGTIVPNIPDPVYEGSCSPNCRFLNATTPDLNHGRGCLQNDPLTSTYFDMMTDYASSTLAGNFDENLCNVTEHDDDCRFVKCVQTTSVSQNTNHLCTTYDLCLQETFDNISPYPSIVSAGMRNDINVCFDDADIYGVGPAEMYDASEYAICYIQNLADFTDWWSGEVDEVGLAAYCGTCNFIAAPLTHGSVFFGTDCNFVSGLGCYQQCRIITQLDSDGLLSAVRTDIWWRSEPEGAGRIRTAYPWRSWYWKPVDGYVFSDDADATDDEALFNNIISLPDAGDYPDNFSHFGAAVDVFNPEGIVGTRVPYSRTNPDNITAATFFGHTDAVITLPEGLDAGLLEMQDLFFRVYNLEWTDGTCTGPLTCETLDRTACDLDVACTWEFYDSNRYDPYGETELGGGNNSNSFAGPEYRPRVLAACGDELCEILNVAGDVIEVTEGITVNGVTGGTLQGNDSSLFVNTRFFYHAHPDHMPVYSIDVDWGDGPPNNFSFTPGKYQNSLPSKWCDSTGEAPGLAGQIMGFAGTDGACRAGYKIFYHDYLYDETRNHDCNGTPTGAPGTPIKPIIANASCYQPRIRVTDNWLWERLEPFNGWIVVHDG